MFNGIFIISEDGLSANYLSKLLISDKIIEEKVIDKSTGELIINRNCQFSQKQFFFFKFVIWWNLKNKPS